MRSKTDIGQILLTGPKNENFATLFAESFQKQGEAVELFAVIEIERGKAQHSLSFLRPDCEKLAGVVVGSLKKTYITAPIIGEDTFEKALSAINAALSRVLRTGKTNWFGGLVVALGAIYKNEFFLSTTGGAQVLMWRDGEITYLSEGLSEDAPRPTKIFQNYSSGRLRSGDRVILSTKQLFNYLSFERLAEYLSEDTIAETSQEIIAALKDAKNAGFATFVLELGTAAKSAPAGAKTQALPRFASPAPPGKIRAVGKMATAILFSLLESLWSLRRRKKWVFVAVGILLALLLVNVAAGLVRKSLRQRQSAQAENLQTIEKLIQDAESAQIYKDDKTVVERVNEAEASLAANGEALPEEKRNGFTARLQEIKNKMSKAVTIENPTILMSFPHVPTDLTYSQNGILGWNRDTNRMAYYDFRSGETKTLLANQTVPRLTGGAFAGGDAGYIFFDRDGIYSHLDQPNEKLVYYEIQGPKGATQMQNLGTGPSARLYLLDISQNQIWRSRMSPTGPAAAEPWFKGTPPNLAGTSDMAIDGSIYLLRAGIVEKYFNGEKQSFELSPVIPALAGATGIFATDESKSIYVLEPRQSRILIFDKTGKLQRQLTSPKFRDAADLYVDETSKIIYVIAGSELLQVAMP